MKNEKFPQDFNQDEELDPTALENTTGGRKSPSIKLDIGTDDCDCKNCDCNDHDPGDSLTRKLNVDPR